MAKTRNLEVVISGDPKQLNRAFGNIDRSAANTEGRLKRMGKVGALAFGGLAVAAGGAAVVGLKKSADAAIEAEKAQARMVAQLKASGVSYRAHAKEIDAVIQRTSKLAGLDDEDLQDAFTNIVRSTGSVDKGLRNIGLAADIARAKHLDVAKAGQLVGRVATGNVTALSRYGIQIDKNATSSEALAELQRRFSGQAEAYGKTTAGSMERAQVAAENLGEVVGAKLAPFVAKGAEALTHLIDRSGELAGPLRTASGRVKQLGTAISDIVNWFRRGSAVGDTLITTVGILSAAWAVNRVRLLAVAAASRVYAAAQLAVNVALRANPIGIVVTALALLAGGLVTAYRRSETFRRIVNGAFFAVRDAMAAVGDRFNRWVIQPMEKIISIAGRVVKALGSVAGVFGGLGSAAKGVAGALNPFGDGLGKAASGIPSPGSLAPLPSGKGAGSLMGARASLAPFANVGSRFGLRVSSGLRPGSRTAIGTSYHSSGEAVDLAGPPGGMLSTFRYLKSHYGPRLAELIHTPGGAGIKDGRPFTYGGAVAADHFDHVHVAFDTGKPGVGDGPGRSNLTTIASFLRGQGFTPAQTAGILGNLRQESNFDPGAIEGGGKGPGIGIAQWSFGRASALKAYARRLNKPWTDLSVQLAFMMSEFHGSESGAFKAIRGARSVGAAETAFGKLYERYGVMGNRSGGQYLALARSVGAGKSVTAPGTTAARAGAQPDTTNPYDLAIAGSDVDIALAQQGGVKRGPGGRVVSSPGLRETSAQRGRLSIVNRRIAKVQKALKRKLRPATRLRLRQELAQLLGERSTIRGRIDELAQPAETSDSGTGSTVDSSGDAAGEGDPNQALIDALEANAQAVIEAANIKAAADAEHAAAIRENNAELKRQTDLASAVQTTESFQLKKYLADVISGQIAGAGVVPRSYTPGSGVAFQY